MLQIEEYYATHGRGTLPFVEKELKSFSSLDILDSIEGKISFKSDLSLKQLKSLRTVERVFVCFLFEKLTGVDIEVNLILRRVENSLNEKRDFFTSSLFKEIIDDEKNESNIEPCLKKRLLPTKFRINCKLTGKWKLEGKSVFIKETILDLITSTMKSFCSTFEIDSDEPDFEIICHLTNAALSLGIPIASKPLSKRDYIQNVGLRSTICSMMLQYCTGSPLTLTLDPFCGKATILTEFLNNSSKRAFSLASDACPGQIATAMENLSILNSSHYNLIQSNLTKLSGSLPYRDHIFDLIVTDLPFEKNHAIQFFNSSTGLKQEIFYKCVLVEFNRLLDQENGVLVILVNYNEWNLFFTVYSQLRLNELITLKIESFAKLSLGQTTAQLVKFMR